MFTGQAATWLCSLPDDKKTTLAAIKTAFLERFNIINNNKISKLKQHETETAMQYFNRVQSLALNTKDLAEETITGLAVENLLPKLKVHVLAANPQTYDQLRDALETASRITECAGASAQDSVGINELCDIFKSLKTQQEQMQQMLGEVQAIQTRPILGRHEHQQGRTFNTHKQYQNRNGSNRHYSSNNNNKQHGSCAGCGKFCPTRKLCNFFNHQCQMCKRWHHSEDVCGKYGPHFNRGSQNFTPRGRPQF